MILYFGFEVCSVSQFIGCCKGVRFLFNNAQTDKYWSNRGKKFVSADPEDSLACSAAVMMLSTFDELAGFAVVALDVDAWREPVGIAACRHSVDGEEAVVGG